MYGLKETHISTITDIFKQCPEIEKAILYGSRAMDTYRNGSDIDLTLVGKKLTLSILYKVEIALDDTYLPHRIDLSIYSKIENPDLVDHIERVGLPFYVKNAGTISSTD